MMRAIVFSIAILQALVVISQQAQVSIIGKCGYVLPDGRIVDFQYLSTPYSNFLNNYEYKFSPCDTFNCLAQDVAVCQEVQGTYDDTILGYQSTRLANYQGGVLNITYMATDAKSVVTCICSQNEEKLWYNTQDKDTYYFNFYSRCCCPDGCKHDPTTGAKIGISVGTAVFILFYFMMTIYFAKKKRQAPASNNSRPVN